MTLEKKFEWIKTTVEQYYIDNIYKLDIYNDILEELKEDTSELYILLNKKLSENNSNLIYKKSINSNIIKIVNNSLNSTEDNIVNDVKSYIDNLIEYIKYFEKLYEKNTSSSDKIVSRISNLDNEFMFSGPKFNIEIITILFDILKNNYDFLTNLNKDIVLSDTDKTSLESSINYKYENISIVIANTQEKLNTLNSDYVSLVNTCTDINKYHGQSLNEYGDNYYPYNQFQTIISDDLLIYNNTKHQYLTEYIFYFKYDIRNILVKDKSQLNILDIYESMNIDDSYFIYNKIDETSTLDDNNYIMHNKTTNVINMVNKLNGLFIKNNEINITIDNYFFHVLTEMSLDEDNFEDNFKINELYVIKKNDMFRDYEYNDTNKEHFINNSGLIYYTVSVQLDLEELTLTSNNLLYFIKSIYGDDKYVSLISEYCEHYFNIHDKIIYSKIPNYEIDHNKNFDSNNDNGELKVLAINNDKTISFTSDGISNIKKGYVKGFNLSVETILQNVKIDNNYNDNYNNIITVRKVNVYERNTLLIELDDNYENEEINSNIINIDGVKYGLFYITNVNIGEEKTQFTLIKTNDISDTYNVNLVNLDIDETNKFIIRSELKNIYIENDNTFSYNKTLKINYKSIINYDSNEDDLYDLSQTTGNLNNNEKYMVKIPDENIFVPMTLINNNIYKNINIFSPHFNLYNTDFINKIDNQDIITYTDTNQNNDTYNLIPNLTGDRLVTRMEFIEQTNSNYKLKFENNFYYFNKNEYKLYNHYNLLSSRYTEITNINDIIVGENYILYENVNDKNFIFIYIIEIENNNILKYIRYNSTVKNEENKIHAIDFTTVKLLKFNDIDDFYYQEDLLIKNDNYYLVPIYKINREKYISTNNNNDTIYLVESLYNNLFQKIFIAKKDIQNGIGDLYGPFQIKTLQNARKDIEHQLYSTTFNKNNELKSGITSQDVYDNYFEKNNDIKFERQASITIPNTTNEQYFNSITLENNILTLVVPSDNVGIEFNYETYDKFNNNTIDITTFKHEENIYKTETEGTIRTEVITISTMIEILKRKICGKFNNNVGDNYSLGNLTIGNKILEIIRLNKHYKTENGNLTIELYVSIIDSNFKNKNRLEKLNFLSGTITIEASNDIVLNIVHREGEKWFWCIILKVIIYFIIYIVWALIGGGIAEAIKSVGSAAFDAGIDALMIAFDPLAGLANWATPNNVSRTGITAQKESREVKLKRKIYSASLKFSENFSDTTLNNLRTSGNTITLENAKKSLNNSEGEALLNKIANKCNLDVNKNRESCIHLVICMASKESSKEIIVNNSYSQVIADIEDDPIELYTTFRDMYNTTQTYNETNDDDPFQINKTTNSIIIGATFGEIINVGKSQVKNIYTSKTPSKQTVLANIKKTSKSIKMRVNINKPIKSGKTVSISVKKLGTGLKTSKKPAIKFAGKLGLKLLDMVGIELIKGGVDWLLYGSYICSSPGALAEIVWEIRKAADSSLSGLVPRFNEKSFNSVSDPYIIFVDNYYANKINNRVKYSSYNLFRDFYNNIIFYNKVDTGNNNKYYFVYNSLNNETKIYIYFNKTNNSLKQCCINIDENFSLNTFNFNNTNNVVLVNIYNKNQEKSAKTNIFKLTDLYYDTDKNIKDYIKDNSSNHFLFEFNVLHLNENIWTNDISAKGMYTLKLTKLINLNNSNLNTPSISYSSVINSTYTSIIINNNYYFMYLTSDDYHTPIIINYKFTKNDVQHKNIYENRKYIKVPITFFKNKKNQNITSTYLTKLQIETLTNNLTQRNTSNDFIVHNGSSYYLNLLYTTSPNLNSNIKFYTLFKPNNDDHIIVRFNGQKSTILLQPSVHHFYNVRVYQYDLSNRIYHLSKVYIYNYDYKYTIEFIKNGNYKYANNHCTLFKINKLNELQNKFINIPQTINEITEFEIVNKLSEFDVTRYLDSQFKSGYILYKDDNYYLLAFTSINLSDIFLINKNFFNIE